MYKTLGIILISFSICFSQDWAQVGSDLDGISISNQFGYSVSLSSTGTTVAIGAINYTGSSGGYVRIYTETGGVWTPRAIAQGSAYGDNFGYSVSLSADGTVLAVGAPQNDTGGSNSGTVYIYSFNGTTLTLIDQVAGEAADDQFGQSVALSANGTRLAVGSQLNDGNGTSSGHVRVFSYNGVSLSQIGSDIDGAAATYYFGKSVALDNDGTILAAGGSYGNGYVRIYEESVGTWIFRQEISGSVPAEEFGKSVSLSSDGSRIAIGGPGYNFPTDTKGVVRVYSESLGTWSQLGSDMVGESDPDRSGESVSLSSDGTRVVIGSKYNSGSVGHARVYSESGGVWSQLGSDVDGEATGDQSGSSVAISGDGSRIASGAPFNDGAADNAGHARVYYLDPSLPVELTSFTLKNTVDGVMSSWTTESEFENMGFAIERKIKDEEWIEIGNYKIDDTLIGQGTTSIPTNYTYVDKLVEPNTTYDYRLLDIDYNGKVTRHAKESITTSRSELSTKLEGITVLPAYPNPFNPSTTITYGLEDNSNVSIAIYNLSGNLITTLLNTKQTQGWHSIEWNGTDQHNNQVPAGIYLSRITSNNTTKTSKLMLLK